MSGDWRSERLAFASAWPRWLHGVAEPTPGEDELWGCANDDEWMRWRISMLKSVPGEHYPGFTGWYASAEALYGPHVAGLLLDNTIAPQDEGGVVGSGMSFGSVAEALCSNFGFSRVGARAGMRSSHINQQLLDARRGFEVLAEILDIPAGSIGGGLPLWIDDQRVGAGPAWQKSLVIGAGAGAAQWLDARWRLNPTLGHRVTRWLLDQPRGARWALERRWQFIEYSRRRLISLAAEDIVSEAGQKMARRLRAVSRWLEDIERGASLETLETGWRRLKTGNRIAWAGSSMPPAWAQEERTIERCLWMRGDWQSVPAWVIRLAEHGGEPDLLDIAKIGLSACVRRRLGYDSWLAQEGALDPTGIELDMFEPLLSELRY